MDLELRHLRIIQAVATAGSVTKAAAALGQAQPAVSAQLRRIERGLGGELFERGRNGVSPTPLGELVLARARVLLPAVQEPHEEVVRLAASHRSRAPARATSLRFMRCLLGQGVAPAGVSRRRRHANLRVFTYIDNSCAITRCYPRAAPGRPAHLE
jgi:DNA-binding transcriptional LysR family regulator